jgi:hypothetical protein
MALFCAGTDLSESLIEATVCRSINGTDRNRIWRKRNASTIAATWIVFQIIADDVSLIGVTDAIPVALSR